MMVKMSGAACRIVFYFAIFQVVVRFAASLHHCAESRVIVDGHLEVTVDCTATNLSTIPVDAFPEDTTHLVLRHLNIQSIPDNAFERLGNLRSLDLSNNDIHALRNASFHGLTKLKTLKLNGNAISVAESGVFSELQSLETLLMSKRKHELSLIKPITALTNLRVLSLTLYGGATVTAEYNSLRKLDALDFFGGEISRIDTAMLDHIRSLNISSLALGYKAAIKALVQTQHSTVDTVILDNVCRGERDVSIFDMSDFCNTFGSNIRRLSLRDNGIIGIQAANAQCLAELRELDLSYNPILYVGPRTHKSKYYLHYIARNMPHLCLFSASMDIDFYSSYCGCEDAALYYDARSYLSRYPTCFAPLGSDGLARVSPAPRHSFPRALLPVEVGIEEVRHVFIPVSIQIIRVEHWRNKRISDMTKSVVFNVDNNIRYINLSYTSIPRVVTGSFFGLHLLETFDISHCNIFGLIPKYVHFPNLKSLNISHNQLDVDLSRFCIGCPKLEDFDISYNKFHQIDPLIFSTCRSLKHINLGGNALQDVYLELNNLTGLETLSLRSCKLLDLGIKFTTELDSLFRVKKFTLDIRNNTFVCTCASLAFVRWIQTTDVHLIARDELTCLLNTKRTLLVDVSLTNLTDECSRKVHNVDVSAGDGVIIISCVVLFGVVAVLVGLVWNRWYIKYRIILCSLCIRSKRRTVHRNKYEAAVLYFAYATKQADHAASRQIAAWVLGHLRPLAEDEEGLKLFIDDRDGTSMTKSQLFIYAFEQSDKLIVCITPEFLNDESCMNNINLAMASNKPLCSFIFINFCDKNQQIPSKQLRYLMRAKSGAICLVWSENDDDHSDFWRRLRGALNRGSTENDCSGLLGRTRKLSTTVSWRELEQINPQ
ncbi:hypothetical protein LSAT2_003529 [Lamellibrachia satsuma]|nr:hypothetical protein LSAT2_003529 [Lamellibrachia satsuma]